MTSREREKIQDMEQTKNSNHANKHDNGFDLLRLLGAILVIYGHSFPLTGGLAPGFMGNPISTIGVKIFFVISGYLIGKSWMSDPHLLRFTAKRSLRILPGFAANIIVVALVLGPLITTLGPSDYFNSTGLPQYFRNLLFYPIYSLPGVFVNNIYPNAVNGSLWSLPVEILMYFTVPIFLARRHSDNGALILIGTALSIAFGVWFVRIHPLQAPVAYYGTSISSILDVACYFQIGALYNFFEKNTLSRKWTSIGILIFLAFAVNDYIMGEIALLLLLPYCVLSFGSADFSIVKRLLGRADISYGMYLYGFPVQQLLVSKFEGMSALRNFAFSLPITALLALASWYLIESPALRFKTQSLRRRES
jgi:peptidoglycan/LPS O-acetylase OafA/YrhL